MNDCIKSLTAVRSKLNNKALAVSFMLGSLIFFLKSKAFCLSSDREAEVKDRIRKIISSGEFNPSAKKSGKTIWQVLSDAVKSFWNWIKGRINREVHQIKMPKGKTGSGDTVGAVILFGLKILCILLIFAFLGAIIFFVFRGIRRSKKIRKNKRISDELLLHTLKDPEILERKAMEYAEKGHFRLAVRFMYISMLLSLNEANIIRIDKSKTNKQYLNEIRMNDKNKYDMALAFTDEFNRSWYGNREVTGERFEYWHQKFNLLVRGGAS